MLSQLPSLAVPFGALRGLHMLHIVLKQCDVKTKFYNVVQLMLLGRGGDREREPFCDPKFRQWSWSEKTPYQGVSLCPNLAKHLMQISVVITSELRGCAMTGISKSFLAVRMKSSRLQKCSEGVFACGCLLVSLELNWAGQLLNPAGFERWWELEGLNFGSCYEETHQIIQDCHSGPWKVTSK